jgi:hypothetical protein
VEGELPAVAVNTYVVVELTDQGTVFDGSFASVSLVPQVVHVAVNRRATALGPGACPVP